MVDFQGGNAELPYVIGNMFNTNAKSGFHKGDNSIKAIRTRSGNSIVLDDAGGSITITDPSGNVIKMDGSQNISITAPKKITIDAGEKIELKTKDIILNGSSSIKIGSGENPSNIVINTSGNTVSIKSSKNIIKGEGSWDGGNVFIN